MTEEQKRKISGLRRAGCSALGSAGRSGGTAIQGDQAGRALKEAARMGEKEFCAELRYRMSLSVARALLEDGVIGEEEYREIDAILLKRHHPVLGTLLAGKSLQ